MNALQIKPLVVPARLTATTNGPAVDLLAFDGKAMIGLNAGATEGATMTLDVKIQHSVDGTTNWTDATMLSGTTQVPAAFTQVTNAAASAQTLDIEISNYHRYIRAVQTLGGTSPAVTAAVTLVAKQRKV
jgi:hypothetical protein